MSSVPPPAPSRATWRPWATYALTALNVLAFLGLLSAGGDLMRPTVKQLLPFGANFGPLTTDGQWWRLLAAAFLHGGLLHLAMNLWALSGVGAFLERVLGRFLYVQVYLWCAVGGSLASVAWNPRAVSVGASGAVFGLFGLLLGLLWRRALPVAPEHLRPLVRSAGAFVLYNLVFGFLSPGIDNAAHIGGLVTGFLAGVVLTIRFAPPAVRTWVLLPLLVATGYVAWHRTQRNPAVQADLAAREASELFEAKDVAGAIAAMDRAITQRPTHGPYYLFRGQLRHLAADAKGARSDYDNAISLEPQNAEPWARRCMLRAEEHDFAGARADCKEALANQPQTPTAVLALLYALELEGDWATLESEVTKALTKDSIPREQLLALRGTAREQQGHLEAALEDYAALRKALPQSPDYRRAYAGALAKAGRVKEALAELPKGRPETPEEVLALARVLSFEPRLDEAIAALDQGLVRWPEHSALHNNRAWLLRTSGRPREALANAERAVELAPQSAAAHGTRCWVRAEVEDLVGALEDCRESVRLDPRIHSDQGMVAFLEGDLVRARASWTEAVRTREVEPWELLPWSLRAGLAQDAGAVE